MKRGPYKSSPARAAYKERQERLAAETPHMKGGRLSWRDPEKRKNRTKAITEAWDDPVLRAIERKRAYSRQEGRHDDAQN